MISQRRRSAAHKDTLQEESRTVPDIANGLDLIDPLEQCDEVGTLRSTGPRRTSRRRANFAAFHSVACQAD